MSGKKIEKMVLDRIIEMELDFLQKKRIPRVVFLSIANFNALVKELESDRHLNSIHNMRIEIVTSSQILVL